MTTTIMYQGIGDRPSSKVLSHPGGACSSSLNSILGHCDMPDMQPRTPKRLPSVEDTQVVREGTPALSCKPKGEQTKSNIFSPESPNHLMSTPPKIRTQNGRSDSMEDSRVFREGTPALSYKPKGEKTKGNIFGQDDAIEPMVTESQAANEVVSPRFSPREMDMSPHPTYRRPPPGGKCSNIFG